MLHKIRLTLFGNQCMLTGAASPLGKAPNTYITSEVRPPTVRTSAREDAIIAAVERDRWRGSCDIARELGLS